MQNNTVYIDMLPKILSSYNNSKNRSIGKTPNQARKPENYGKVYLKMVEEDKPTQPSPPSHFKIGDSVRIAN